MSKILITSTYFYPYISGLSLYPYRLAKLLVSKNHQLSILTFQYESNLKPSETINKIKITRIKSHLRISKGLVNFFYPLYAFRQIRQANLVILNLPSLENFWVAFLAKIMNKKIITLYHCDLDLRTNFLIKFASHLTNLVSWFCCLLSFRIINSSKEYSRTSPVLKFFLNKISYHFPLAEVVKLDQSYLKQLKQTYTLEKPVIGFVGRFSSEKNLETLIQALSKLKRVYPRLLLLCVGPYSTQVAGEKRYYQKIQCILNEFEINYAVLGILNESRLTAFYRFINLLVLPSNNRTEAFGIVQIEALKQQTPVITTNSPGINQVVNLTQAGLLFRQNDSRDLASKIKQLLKQIKQFENKTRLIEEKLKLKQSQQKLLALFEN